MLHRSVKIAVSALVHVLPKALATQTLEDVLAALVALAQQVPKTATLLIRHI